MCTCTSTHSRLRWKYRPPPHCQVKYIPLLNLMIHMHAAAEGLNMYDKNNRVNLLHSRLVRLV